MQLVVRAVGYDYVAHLGAVERDEALAELKPFLIACYDAVSLAVDESYAAVDLFWLLGQTVERCIYYVVYFLCVLAVHVNVVSENYLAVNFGHSAFLYILPVLYVLGINSFFLCLGLVRLLGCVFHFFCYIILICNRSLPFALCRTHQRAAHQKCDNYFFHSCCFVTSFILILCKITK